MHLLVKGFSCTIYLWQDFEYDFIFGINSFQIWYIFNVSLHPKMPEFCLQFEIKKRVRVRYSMVTLWHRWPPAIYNDRRPVTPSLVVYLFSKLSQYWIQTVWWRFKNMECHHPSYSPRRCRNSRLKSLLNRTTLLQWAG